MSWKDAPLVDDAPAQSGNWQSAPVVEEAPSPPKPSPAEAFGRGAVQGATLGFGDELGAAAQGFLQYQSQFLPQGFKERLGIENAAAGGSPLDVYRQARTENRQLDQRAQQAEPEYYLGGSIAGGLPVAAVTPGYAGAALTGAAAGLGSSEADLTRGEVGEAALDTALGAGAGLAGEAVGRGVGKVVAATGRALAPTVKKFALDRFLSALGTMKRDRQLLAKKYTPEQLRQFLSENGIVTPLAGLETIGERLGSVEAEAGQEIGAILKKLSEGQRNLEGLPGATPRLPPADNRLGAGPDAERLAAEWIARNRQAPAPEASKALSPEELLQQWKAERGLPVRPTAEPMANRFPPPGQESPSAVVRQWKARNIPEAPAAPAPAPVEVPVLRGQDLQAALRGEAGGMAGLPGMAGPKGALERWAGDIEQGPLSIERAMAVKRSFDPLARFDRVDPSLQGVAAQRARGLIRETIDKHLLELADAGEAVGLSRADVQALRDANTRYGIAAMLEHANFSRQAGWGANRAFSLTDTMAGLAGLAKQGPSGILWGIANKIGRTLGPGSMGYVANALGERMSTMAMQPWQPMLARAAAESPEALVALHQALLADPDYKAAYEQGGPP